MLVPSVRKSLGDVDAAGDPYVLERLDVFEKCLYVWNYVCVPHNLGMMHQTHDSPGNIVIHIVKVCSVCLEDLPRVPKSCLDTVDVVVVDDFVAVFHYRPALLGKRFSVMARDCEGALQVEFPEQPKHPREALSESELTP